MKICKTLSEFDFPPNVRVENESLQLLKDGHDVFLVCRNLTKRPPSEIWKGIHIIRIDRPNKPWHYFNFFSRFVFHFDFQWYSRLQRLAQAHHFDVFHVHDLPLAGTVISLAKQLGIPVVVDLHENYPAVIPFRRKSPEHLVERWMHSIFYGVDQWKRYERTVLSQADRLLVVVDEEAKRIQQLLGGQAPKITVVGNTLNVASFGSQTLHTSILERFSEDFVVSYIGTVTRNRRIDTLIRAMPLVHSSIPNARLVVVGDISGHPEHKESAATLGMEDIVVFEGWQPFDLVPSYLAASALGVLPLEEGIEQTDNSMPIKLFEYFYMQRPLIVSDSVSLRRIMDETGGGVVVKGAATDPDVLAQAIISLKDERVRQEMGRRGRRAVIEKYNWEVDAARLSKMYRELEAEMEVHKGNR